MSSSNIFESKLFRIIILSTVGLIILVFVFGLGVFVGTKKADFSFRWADEYHRNFGGPQGGLFGNFMGTDKEFANANGVFGQIIKIDSSNGAGQVGNLTVKDKDNVEKIVFVNNDTSIIYQRKNIKFSDLKMGDNIVVIGEPNNNGQIQAELIRTMPAPPNPKGKILPLNNLPVKNK
jgi:hypothetical protein